MFFHFFVLEKTEKDIACSLICFSMFFFCFSDHTFGPHHFWPRSPLGPLADQTRFVPNPMRIILENLGQWGCSFVVHVLFFGPWTTLRGTSLAQNHPVRDDPSWCGCVVVVLCCVVVCRCGVCSKFSWVRPKFGPGPLPRLHSLRGTPLRRTGPPKISLFFFLHPATVFILSSSLGGRFAEFLVV